ncbi:MAG: PPC domain-containing protein, partial [Cyanobacteria bacterium P01_H01_bin.15]
LTPEQTAPPRLQRSGILDDNDDQLDDGSLFDLYVIQGKSGDVLDIVLESDDFDPYLAIANADKVTLQESDDIGGGNQNASLKIQLPEDGAYYIIINSYTKDGRGNYILTIR